MFLYLSIVGLVGFIIFMFGMVIPQLVSMRDSGLFLIGVMLAGVVPYVCWKAGVDIWGQIKKRFHISSLTILSLVCLTGCERVTVPPGHVGVKVYLYGNEKGVDQVELGTGRYWLGWNEQMYLFPVFQQNYVWTKDATEGSPNDESLSFQTSEGLLINADFGISFTIDPTKVSVLFETYRRNVDEIIDVFLRNMVRDALNKRSSTLPVESVYGAGKQALIESVQADVAARIAGTGITINQLYLINHFRLPPTVVEALNNKIVATQRSQQRENEVKEAEAEARKLEAQARGIQEKQRMEALTLTPEYLKRLWIEKWDGKLPNVMTGNDLEMLLPLETLKSTKSAVGAERQ